MDLPSGSDAQADSVIADLQVDAAALKILLVHFLGQIGREHPAGGQWLRAFGEAVYASVDRAPRPTGLTDMRMAEQLRDRLDQLIYGAKRRLER